MSSFMAPSTLFMAANILWSLPFTYWFLLSFTQCVLFLTQRINSPSLLSLFPAPRYNVVNFSSPCLVILSHLSKTAVCILLCVFCNVISSQDATVCTQRYCVLINTQWVDLTQKSGQECWNLQKTPGNTELCKLKYTLREGCTGASHTCWLCWVADSRCWLLLTLRYH